MNEITTQILNPQKGDYVDSSTSLRCLYSGFRFTEGLVWDGKRERLYFSDIKGNAIYQSDGESAPVLFRDNSYMANGNTVDDKGTLYTCEHATSRISSTTLDGVYSVVVDSYEGKELNSPNDLIVSSTGVLYFTDPPSGRSAGFGIPRERQLDFCGVYGYDPATRELRLLTDEFTFPNGLTLSEDERTLYVNDTKEALIKAFDIDRLECGPSRLFARLPEDLPGKADGLKIDSLGNLFTTGAGGILIYSPQGELLARIFVPEQTANFCWGQADLKRLYIAASRSIYTIDLKIPGRLSYCVKE